MSRILYKFRQTDDLMKIIDILNNQRLFMSNYEQQRKIGDENEGCYTHSASIPQKILDDIRREKLELLICSVKNRIREKYMWQEYADNGKGLCVAFTIEEYDDVEKIKYDYTHPSFSNEEMYNHARNKLARDILCHKLAKYKVEKEYRLLKRADSGLPFVNIKIKTVYLGWRMDACMADFIRLLIKERYGDTIKIRQLRNPVW